MGENILTFYAVPKKLSETLMAEGRLIWQPYVRIIYKTKKGKVDILADSLIPELCKDPIVAVLATRKTSLVKLSTRKPIEGIVLDHRLSGLDLVNYFLEAYENAEKLAQVSEEDFYERTQLDIDWSRYRALFLPSRRLINRKEPIFRYLIGRNEASPYVIGLYLKGLIESGLKIVPKTRVDILLSQKAYYPLILTNDFRIYEPAWKLSESILYNWIIDKYPQVKEFYSSV